MTLSATGMNLAGGTPSPGLISVAATQDIDASRATLHGGGLDLSAANLATRAARSRPRAMRPSSSEASWTTPAAPSPRSARPASMPRAWSTATAPWPAAT
ncbi:hypothetical protein WJ970_21165 [Achromobacter xylosoxidans]